jgi:hypothetical protein
MDDGVTMTGLAGPVAWDSGWRHVLGYLVNVAET